MWSDRFTVGLSAFFLAGSTLALFFWFPNDIETGVVETFRRRTTIGDAMAPTVVMVGILISSILMGISSIFEGRKGNNNGDVDLDRRSFTLLFRVGVVAGIALILMVYSGPLLVELSNFYTGENTTYRHLKATAPYKYTGYFLGGLFLVAGLIRVVENQFSGNTLWISLAAVISFIIFYDFPFDNLLLPPNGDY